MSDPVAEYAAWCQANRGGLPLHPDGLRRRTGRLAEILWMLWMLTGRPVGGADLVCQLREAP